VFGGAIKTSFPENVNYVNYQLPGILLMTVSMSVAYTAFRLFNDKKNGLIARFNAMPIGRSAILWGHVLTSLVSTMATFAIIFLASVIIGFRPRANILEWLCAIAILILFTLALTWLAVIAALTAKTLDGANAFVYPVVFLPFLSSTFVPTETMPGGLRIFAENQPVTSIVESLRALFNSEPVGNDIWGALAWCTGITIIAWFFAMRAYKRRII
jgi:ABC-2 type transport system permease protein